MSGNSPDNLGSASYLIFFIIIFFLTALLLGRVGFGSRCRGLLGGGLLRRSLSGGRLLVTALLL